MAFKFNRDTKAAQAASKGGVIDTGVHVVKILNAYLYEFNSGENAVDLEIETKTGQKGTIFGICVDEKRHTGGENYDYPRWMELVEVADMKTGDTVMVKRKVMKNGKEVEEDAVAFKELQGFKCTMAIQIEKDWYNGQEKDKRNLHSTYFLDGRSLSEVAAGIEVAKRSKSLATKLKDYESKAYKNRAAANAEAGAIPNDEAQDTAGSAEAEGDEDLF
jgi:hypothetical protein